MRSVISLHGIRTRGVWQRTAATMLARAGLIPHSLDYGWYRAIELLLPWRREAILKWFVAQYERICAEDKTDRPSIICHSFGSWILAAAIARFPYVMFDKVILCGSIVDENYDWETPLATGQVRLVRNDFGMLDPFPRIAKMFVANAGNSGTRGFVKSTVGLTQMRFPRYRHSDFFERNHMQSWVSETLVPDCGRLLETLRYVVRFTANHLRLPEDKVRACIHTRVRGSQLKILPGMSVNMDNEAELRLPVPIGDKSDPDIPGVAFAFRENEASVCLFAADWRTRLMSASTNYRPHPELKWAISVPICPEDAGDGLPQEPLGVLTVDGLAFAPSVGVLSDYASNELMEAATWATNAMRPASSSRE